MKSSIIKPLMYSVAFAALVASTIYLADKSAELTAKSNEESSVFYSNRNSELDSLSEKVYLSGFEKKLDKEVIQLNRDMNDLYLKSKY